MFSRKDNLIAHIRTYLGVKVYTCDHCAIGFPRKENLIAHMATHTEVYVSCNQCSKKFLRKFDLKTHIQVSHKQTMNSDKASDNGFQLVHCTRSYLSKRNLRKHTEQMEMPDPLGKRGPDNDFETGYSIATNVEILLHVEIL